MSLNLTGYSIFDAYGTDRIKLDGEFDSESLASYCIKNWVPYIECDRKCWGSSFCGFVKEDNSAPGRLKEIRCEPGVRAIKHFVKYTFTILEKLNNEKIQNYLDAIYHFYKYLFESNMLNCEYLNSNSFETWRNYAPGSIGRIKTLRVHIDSMCDLLQDIPEFGTKDSIIFVEGKTEEVFLKKLRQIHFVDLISVKVKSYGGRGNLNVRRIEMMLRDYKRRGFEVFIQGDADGNNINIFSRLERINLVNSTNKFVFKHDFESSIPHDLLYYTLRKLGYLKYKHVITFINRTDAHKGSIISFLKDSYSIDVEPIKKEFGETVATFLVKSHRSWWQDDFMTSELGKFINFVRTMQYVAY